MLFRYLFAGGSGTRSAHKQREITATVRFRVLTALRMHCEHYLQPETCAKLMSTCIVPPAVLCAILRKNELFMCSIVLILSNCENYPDCSISAKNIYINLWTLIQNLFNTFFYSLKNIIEIIYVLIFKYLNINLILKIM